MSVTIDHQAEQTQEPDEWRGAWKNLLIMRTERRWHGYLTWPSAEAARQAAEYIVARGKPDKIMTMEGVAVRKDLIKTVIQVPWRL
jgi:hypothetical protein